MLLEAREASTISAVEYIWWPKADEFCASYHIYLGVSPPPPIYKGRPTRRGGNLRDKYGIYINVGVFYTVLPKQ